jgi:hypothetical protein
MLAFEICVPAGILYLYTANILSKNDFSQEKLDVVTDEDTDVMSISSNIERIMTATLLPLSFFLFARRLLGAIVLEKEKGMLAYLKMNGMSEMAYNLSFVLHEALINGPLICLVLDLLVWYRCYYTQERELDVFVAQSLLKFNLGIIMFIMGITAMIIVISKCFSTAGFATQIGSLMYLVPVFLSIYLRAIDMKHKMSEAANKKYIEMEDKMDE